jgi:hypothetical protein
LEKRTGLAVLSSHINLANAALAQADLHPKLARLEAAMKTETDPGKLDALYSQAQGHLETSSQLIDDPRSRELWKARHLKDVTAVQLVGEAQQRKVYNDRYHAGSNQAEENEIQTFAQSDDPAVQERARNNLAVLHSSQVLAGVLTETQAQAAAHKANQHMLLGRAQVLDSTGRSADAEALIRANPTAGLEHLLPHLEARRKKERGDALGRTVATGGRTDFGGEAQPSQPTASKNLENFNFGNMKAVGGGWRTFASEEEGAQAIGDWLVRHNQAGQTTIRQLIDDPQRGYAPTVDSGNAGKKLPEAAAKIVGVDPDQPIDMRDPALRRKMVGAIVQQEFGERVSQRALSAYDRAPATTQVAAAGSPVGVGETPLAASGAPIAAAHVGPPTLEEQFATIDATPGYDDDERQRAKIVAQQMDNQRRAGMRGEIATVKRLMGADLASIEQTGQEIAPLTYDRVLAAHGPEIADNWQEERTLAHDCYDQTSNFDQLPNYELDRSLERMRVAGAGQPGFDKRQRLYAMADRKAKMLEDLRTKSPADAVAKFPEVIAASQGANLSQPSTYRPLVEARIRAMNQIDLPLDAQIPITQNEARILYQPLKDALGTGDQKALYYTENGVVHGRLRQLIETVEQGWGGYTPQALAMVMGVGHATQQTQETLHTVLKKLGAGEMPTSQEGRALDQGMAAGASGAAVAGLVPAATSAPPPVPDVGAMQRLRQNPQEAPSYDAIYGPGAAARVLGTAPSAQAPGAAPATPAPSQPAPAERVYRTPDAAAIQALQRRPQTRAGFEATYGPGSADRHLPPVPPNP